MTFNLVVDSVVLLTICVVCVLRLNEQKHDVMRTMMLSCALAGSFGLGCEQIARGRVFGPDIWPIMMHIGIAGMMLVRCIRTQKHDPERRHIPDRRTASD